MYVLDRWYFPTCIEWEYKFSGNYGAKGEKRLPRHKATPEEIKRQNRLNKSKKVRRLVLANFTKGDYWTTLTYEAGTAKTIDGVKSDLSCFIRHIRKAYKRQGIPLKYIYRLEIGSRGGLHVHILMNRINDLDTLITGEWTHGHVNIEMLNDGAEDAEKLADYITKPPTAQQMKLLKSIGDSEDARKLIQYSGSRNLTRPAPIRNTVKRKTMRSVYNSDICPTEGFYIHKDSIVRGINTFTGYSYLHYREYLLTDKVKKAKPVKLCECPYCHQFTIDAFACSCQTTHKRIRRRQYG